MPMSESSMSSRHSVSGSYGSADSSPSSSPSQASMTETYEVSSRTTSSGRLMAHQNRAGR